MPLNVNMIFMYFGVMYSGANDVCGVTLSSYPNRATWKIYLTTAGIEPWDSIPKIACSLQ